MPYHSPEIQTFFDRASLSAEEMVNAHAWFKKNLGAPGRSCPVCGSGRWGLEPHFAQMPIMVRDEATLGGPTFPFVLFYCVQCFHTVPVNAIRSGIMLKDSPKDSPEAEGDV
jgi:hypothetical protein